MDSVERRIKAIIDVHLVLAAVYKRMMVDIESKSLFFCLEKESAKPEAADRRKTGNYVWNTYNIFTRCFPTIWWRKEIEPQKGYMFKPYVKYFLSAHIRRQYQKLYSLYLSELVIQRKNSPKDDLCELREIASDIRHYSETLPSLKNLAALLLGALTILGTVFAIFDVKFPLEEIQKVLRDPYLAVFLILIILLIANIGFAIAFSPFVAAFHFKRFLFKGNNSKDFHYFSRDKVKATELYNSSVYRLEDRLFELLGGKEQKPKEVPIDIILRISLGALLITLYTINGYYFYIFFENMLENRVEDSQPLSTYYPLMIEYTILIAILVVTYVASPIADYKTRVKTGLV